MSGERFIPFHKTSIIAMCAGEVPPGEQDSFKAVTDLLASHIHHEFRARLEALKEAYHPFNPDADTRTIVDPTPAERQAAQRRLTEDLTALAEDANFERIEPEDLSRAFVEESLLKVRLKADFDDFEEVVFYRRGEKTSTEVIPLWYKIRSKTIQFTTYSKVLVYVKFKDADHFTAKGKDVNDLSFEPGSMIIKLFQNVPRADLEMLFPNTQVQMRVIDKLLFGVPAVVSGVIVLVSKLFAALLPLLLLFAVWLKLRDAPVDFEGPQIAALGAGLVAAGGYLFRQWTKFKNRKILFMKTLSENLYFRNLDNGAGVFHHLLDAAEEEEAKEALLAYHLLRTADRPLTQDELDQRIEDWFANQWDARFDFEIEDGIGKVRRLRLVEQNEIGQLKAVALPEAKRRLDEAWDNLFTGA